MGANDNSLEADEITRFLNAWFAVRQLIQAANFNHFHQSGLSATQFMTLNVLPHGDESITIGDLAKRMNLKPATVAKTVDSLEARQMVSRQRSPADRRIVLVQMTEKGKKLQNAAAGHFRDYISKIFGAVPAKHRAALIAGLESLVQAAGALTPTGAAPPPEHNSQQSPRR